MTGIHRERPGADAISPSTGEPATDLGDGIWLSPGLSNSYLLQTDDGRIVVNTDAHHTSHLDKMRYGVRQLRRAWLNPPDLVGQVGVDPVTLDPIMEIGVKATGAAKQFIRLNVALPP